MQEGLDKPANETPARRYTSRRIHNVRAVPQLDAEDRDAMGPIPFLMLRGAWLRRLDFTVDREFHVEASPGKIVVTLLDQEPAADGFSRLEAEVRYGLVEES